MKIATALLASVAAIGLLSACGDDDKLTIPTSASAPEFSTPAAETPDTDAADAPGVTSADASSAETFPSNFTVPQETIDLMIAQFEAAGMKVDKECFTALLGDEGLRELAAAGGQGTPSPELTQKFLACLLPGT
jgi:hypothetical protein